MTKAQKIPAPSPRKPEDIKRQPMCAECFGTDSHAFHCQYWVEAVGARLSPQNTDPRQSP